MRSKFKCDFLSVLQTNISQLFSFIDMLAGYPFCHCVIVLKIANYTAELKQILVNYYLYSVFPVASILAVSLQRHLQCSILVLLSFKEPSCSHSYFYHGSLAFPWTSPQVHFLEPLSVIFFKHMLWFSSPSSTALLSSQRPGSCILIED